MLRSWDACEQSPLRNFGIGSRRTFRLSYIQVVPLLRRLYLRSGAFIRITKSLLGRDRYFGSNAMLGAFLFLSIEWIAATGLGGGSLMLANSHFRLQSQA
jgi:hypothetical protein